MSSITFNDLSDFKNFIKTGAISVLKEWGQKIKRLQQEPFWKRRTESDIARLRKDLSRQDDWLKGKWKKRWKKDLGKKYKIKAKGFKVVIEELKQKISAKFEKLRC